MNICFVHHDYPPEGRGGICTYVYTMAHTLADLGHVVHVIAYSTRFVDTDDMDGKVHVHRVCPIIPNRLLYYAYLPFNRLVRTFSGLGLWKLFASRRVALKLQQLIAEEGVQVVEGAECDAELFWYTLFMDRKIPVVVKLHSPTHLLNAFNDMSAGQDAELETWMERQQTILADRVVSPSMFLAELVGQKWGIPVGRSSKRHITVIPNPIDARMFFPLRRERGGAGNGQSLTILYTGRIERLKGVHTLIEALPKVLERIPAARIRLIGADTPTGPGGTLFARYLLARLDDRLQSAIEWCGPRPRRELVREYQNSAVCAFPSLFDNFPNTCLEAMACGAPVVGSQNGGMAEMIEPGVSGLLVPPEDPDILAQALLMMLEDRAAAARMGQAARQRIETVYSPEQVVRQTVELYEQAIASKS